MKGQEPIEVGEEVVNRQPHPLSEMPQPTVRESTGFGEPQIVLAMEDIIVEYFDEAPLEGGEISPAKGAAKNAVCGFVQLRIRFGTLQDSYACSAWCCVLMDTRPGG
jgi:hypothetical protein